MGLVDFFEDSPARMNPEWPFGGVESGRHPDVVLIPNSRGGVALRQKRLLSCARRAGKMDYVTEITASKNAALHSSRTVAHDLFQTGAHNEYRPQRS